jgi:carbamoyltransferase
MKFLGISSYYHDSAVALVDESQILFAAQEERYSRIKGDSRFPILAIKNMERYLELSSRDFDIISYYEDPRLKLNRILTTFVKEFPGNHSQILNFVKSFDKERFFPKKRLELEFPESKVVQYGHHQSHAASTFYTSTFENAAVLVMDGVGEWATSSIFAGSANGLELLEEELFPDSLGLFYATITSFCGFKVNSGEYKLMGLAPYGEPKYVKLLKDNVIEVSSTGRIKLNMDYFGFHKNLRMHSQAFEDLVQHKPRRAESSITQFECDLARSVQEVLEIAVVRKSLHAIAIADSKNLALAGGVALNCVANSKILDHLSARNVYVQPASGDAGGALGAAILARREFGTNTARQYKMCGSFLGNSYSDEDVASILKKEDLVYECHSNETLIPNVVELLLDNQAIGWFQGRMEFGPRALGGRSIIAAASSSETQSKLNLKVKKRESFRPFAPIVLESEVSNWFEWEKGVATPYMLFTAQVAKNKTIAQLATKSEQKGDQIDLIDRVNEIRSTIPAVTHVDNSARIQTIDETNPTFSLLTHYYARSGTPVLVNTSFNVRNEPIVESPLDAIRCFLTTDLDALVIGGFLLKKQAQHADVLDRFKKLTFNGDLD